MKKALSSFCIGAMVLLACNDSATRAGDEAAAQQPQESTAAENTGSGHTASPSGPSPDSVATAAAPLVRASYSGTLPCADCEGIEVSLTLLSDSSFHKKNIYLGRKTGKSGSNEFVDTGKYVMKGDTMVLDLKDGPNQYIKTDSGLVQLDTEGKRIRSKMASKYVLRKSY